MKLYIKTLLFVFVALVTNVKVVSATITFSNIQEATIFFSFNNETPKTIDKVIENDLASCCENEQNLVAYRSWGISVIGKATKGGANLTKAQLKSISSLESQIAKHQTKLAEYIKDPMKFDNKGFLKNAPNDAVRQKIIQSRINHLNQEIQTFQNNIRKILNGQ